MTRPHPVEGKARTRKPGRKALLDRIEANVKWVLDFDAAAPQTLSSVLKDVAELRRSLRDTRGKR